MWFYECKLENEFIKCVYFALSILIFTSATNRPYLIVVPLHHIAHNPRFSCSMYRTTFSLSCWYQSVPHVTATSSQLFTPRDLWLPRFCCSAEDTTIATYRHNQCIKLHGAGLTHFLADLHTYSQTAEC
jgi:hypothetical protein